MRPLCLIGLTLLVSGCGVADYEERMIKSQERLARLEEDRRLLAEPIVVPTAENKDKQRYPIANLFFRPPIGVHTNHDAKNSPREGLLYTYRLPEGTGGPVPLVEVAIVNEPKDKKDLTAEVLKLFPVPAGTQTVGPRSVGKSVQLETTEFKDGRYFYSVNVWRGANKQAALVYYANATNQGTARPAIARSLESFAMDAEASQRREEYNKDTQWGQNTVGVGLKK